MHKNYHDDNKIIIIIYSLPHKEVLEYVHPFFCPPHILWPSKMYNLFFTPPRILLYCAFGLWPPLYRFVAILLHHTPPFHKARVGARWSDMQAGRETMETGSTVLRTICCHEFVPTKHPGRDQIYKTVWIVKLLFSPTPPPLGQLHTTMALNGWLCGHYGAVNVCMSHRQEPRCCWSSFIIIIVAM